MQLNEILNEARNEETVFLVKQIIRKLFHSLGYEVFRYRQDTLGVNSFGDIRRFVGDCKRPVVFDVGANIGQSAHNFKRLLPSCVIHCFEPSPTTYETLVKNTKNYSGVYINNLALGSVSGKKPFLENSQNNMSSFLKPGKRCWGEIVGETLVEMSTLDRYCEQNRIESIDVLKTDTQGYDFEVLKGAPFLLKHNRIHMIYMEIIFLDIYQDLPPFDIVFRFLNDNNFRLVSFYRFNHQNNLASWSDALFINLQYRQGKNA